MCSVGAGLRNNALEDAVRIPIRKGTSQVKHATMVL